jgi:outer membrane assembly lipoprotein YfiO
MLRSAYTYYLQNKYEEAISSAQRIISLHPGNRKAVYAYYLIGQSYYERISEVARDQKITELALNPYKEVIRGYPESDYAKDAQLKMDETRDHLAGKERYMGRYYLKQSAFLAAINRVRNVVTEYQNTSHTPEALHRIVEGYISLGLNEEAKGTAAVLGYNFPESEWYKSAYELINDFLK